MEKIIQLCIKDCLNQAEELFMAEAEKGTSIFDIWNISQIHQLRSVAFLFGDLYYLRACKNVISKFSSERNK